MWTGFSGVSYFISQLFTDFERGTVEGYFPNESDYFATLFFVGEGGSCPSYTGLPCSYVPDVGPERAINSSDDKRQQHKST